jgi:teichoic acid transport system permease protein
LSSGGDARREDLQPIGVRPQLVQYLAAVWRARDFVLTLPLAQVRQREANTLLGSLWHLLNPLILAATYFIVFGVVFDATKETENYAAFLVVGLLVFQYTQKCLFGGSRTVTANSAVMRSINLPKAIFPLASVIAETLVHLPAVSVMLVVVAASGELPQWTWLAVVPALALQSVFNLGLALWVGRLSFQFRDLDNLLPFVTRILLYLSGVFFAAERVPEGLLRDLFEANPLQVFLEVYREALLDQHLEASTWLQAVIWSLLLLVTGLVFFWRRESSYSSA